MTSLSTYRIQLPRFGLKASQSERLNIPVAGVVSHVYQSSRFHWMGLRVQGVMQESPTSVALLENISHLELIKYYRFVKKVLNSLSFSWKKIFLIFSFKLRLRAGLLNLFQQSRKDQY
jgi:hypothetical protein